MLSLFMGMYERRFRRPVFIKIVEFSAELSLLAAFISRDVLCESFNDPILVSEKKKKTFSLEKSDTRDFI